MTKDEFIRAVSEKAEITQKKAAAAVNAFQEVLFEVMSKGEEVRIPGFGVFLVKERAERQGKNPQTGEAITIPAKKVPVFKPGKLLKEAVNQ